MFYSPSKNTWFDPDSRAAYEASDTWPADAKEYPLETFLLVVINRPAGKIMQPGANGDPVLVDQPAPSAEELSAAAISHRDALLAASDWTQLRDVPDATAAAWAPYRQALRDLTSQSGFPTSINWPTQPA